MCVLRKTSVTVIELGESFNFRQGKRIIYYKKENALGRGGNCSKKLKIGVRRGEKRILGLLRNLIIVYMEAFNVNVCFQVNFSYWRSEQECLRT